MCVNYSEVEGPTLGLDPLAVVKYFFVLSYTCFLYRYYIYHYCSCAVMVLPSILECHAHYYSVQSCHCVP